MLEMLHHSLSYILLDKIPLNQVLHIQFDGDNISIKKFERRSQLPYLV